VELQVEKGTASAAAADKAPPETHGGNTVYQLGPGLHLVVDRPSNPV